MQHLSRIFLSGLFTVLPLAITLAILYWLATSAESILGNMIGFILPEAWYVPGMGLAAGIAVIFSVGILIRQVIFQSIFKLVETQVNRVPLVKTLYNGIRDFIDYFSPQNMKEFNQTVMIPVDDSGQRHLMGLITRTDFTDVPDEVGDENSVAVYLPMSFQIGGFMIIVPKDHVKKVEMGVEESLRFIFTGGVAKGGKNAKDGKNKNPPKEPLIKS